MLRKPCFKWGKLHDWKVQPTLHPQAWYCSSKRCKTSLWIMFGSKPTAQIVVGSLKHYCKDFRLTNFTTFLLLDQRTCRRLARQWSLGRDGARRVFWSGHQCWCPYPGRRAHNRPGNSLHQREKFLDWICFIWYWLQNYQPDDEILELDSAQKHRSMVIEAMSRRRPKTLVRLNIFKKWTFSPDEHFQTREVLQSTESR